jgi:UDP-glucose 4-epimerase
LCEYLTQSGYKIRVIDKRAPSSSNVDWIAGDVLESDAVKKAVHSCDVVFDLVAIADPAVCIQDPDSCLRINELGTMGLLLESAKSEVKRFVLASTIWVYGNTIHVADETAQLPPPLDLYTKTKLGQEHLVLVLSKKLGLRYTILRYGIPFGPRMRTNMAIYRFIESALAKQPLFIRGKGDQGRSWIYISDLVEGTIKSLDSMGENEIFNIAGSEYLTLNEVIERLRRILPDITVNHTSEDPGGLLSCHVSIEKARRSLGWRPKASFDDGLKTMVEWMKSGS